CTLIRSPEESIHIMAVPTGLAPPHRRPDMSSNQPYVSFHDGRRAPQLGFGTWQIPEADAPGAVHAALEAGYRSIDTAYIYYNEAGVGQGIARSGMARDEIFVATKVWNNRHG